MSSSLRFMFSWASPPRLLLHVILAVLILFDIPVHGVVVGIDSSNIDETLSRAEVVFVNFYADWCRFSQMLTPVFEEASNRFEDQKDKVVFASVDCDRQVEVAQKYHINKYPTLKLFRDGQLAKREYRGQRSADALVQFVSSQLESPIKDFSSAEDLESRIDKKKPNLIAYFTSKEGPEWENLRRIVSNLREECKTWVAVGDNFKQQTMGGNNIAFRPPRMENEEQLFTGNMQDMDYFRQWVTDKCIPLVREITFENAEELTEEGIPFLILFRDPSDSAILDTFNEVVARELADQKNAVNFLFADGKKFAHPLHHLGKSERDLPVLAIDSFRHMYLFPEMKELNVAGKLRQFVLDLHSGKLHREFHHGPDPTEAPPSQPSPADGGDKKEQPPSPPAEESKPQGKTSPPPSVFEKLKPSRTRYTILKDEL